MAKPRAEDFEISEWEGCREISIESERIRECMEHYEDAKLDGVSISPHHGYRLKDLAFLKDYPFITRISVCYADNIDISYLGSLHELRSLTLSFNKQPLDFSAFPNLEEISVDWHSKMTFPKASKAMKRLAMTGYKPKSKDLSELPEFSNMEELEIVQSPLQSLAGLGRFKKLKHLKLYYLSKLERIADLDAPSLENLEFDVCRKISDHVHVATLSKLRILRLNDCGKVPSLKFLDKMPALEEFAFVDTNVLDGDLTPCFRLKWVGFLNKRHYSHTEDEVDAIIAERQRKAKRKK